MLAFGIMTEGYALEYFSGEGNDASLIYRTKWRRALLTKMAGRGHPFLQFGLLPRILGANELLKHNPTGVNTDPLEMPLALAGTPTNFAAAEYANARSNYYRQEQEIATAAGKIHDALGETPKQLLVGAHGILTSDLRIILERLDAQYLVVTKREIDEAIHVLEGRYEPGDDLRKLISTHKTIHATLEEAGEPLSLHLKVNYLMRAVSHIKALSDCIDSYMRGQPNRALHSFDDLATSLKAHVANRAETVFSVGYANVATTESLTERILELERMNKTLSERLTQAERRGREQSTAPRAFKYCWTHGKCAHTSQECDPARQRDGHQRTATFHDQMGGRSTQM